MYMYMYMYMYMFIYVYICLYVYVFVKVHVNVYVLCIYMYTAATACPDSATWCTRIWPIWHSCLQHVELCGTHWGPVSVQRCLWGQLCWGLVCYLSLLDCFDNNEMTSELSHIKSGANHVKVVWPLCNTWSLRSEHSTPMYKDAPPHSNLACWCCSSKTLSKQFGKGHRSIYMHAHVWFLACSITQQHYEQLRQHTWYGNHNHKM